MRDKAPAIGGAPVRCTACAHYYVTHEVPFPHGCRALEFKSARLPMQDVLNASGRHCLVFVPKRH